MTRQLIEINTRLKLATEDCCNCGVVFAMPDSMQRRVQANGAYFYCPNGHPQHYTESDVQRLEKQLGRAEADREFYRKGRDGALDALSAANKEAKRLKCRINSGTCPHCRRHFVNVERHMQSKHPGDPRH